MVRVLLVLYSLVFVMQVSAQVSSDVHTHRGNQSFEKGDFDDASYHYLKTLQGKSEILYTRKTNILMPFLPTKKH